MPVADANETVDRRAMSVAGRRVADDTDCYVIAEIGHNHGGCVEVCRQLISQAQACGADAVKLQKRDNRALYTQAFYDSPYDHPNSYGPTYGAHREALEFDRAQLADLRAFADELEITLFATPFDFGSADVLAALEMPAYKIASGDLTNTPLIEHVARFGQPMFISTGGGTMDDVRRAHDVAAAHNPQVCVMQCTSGYPCRDEELNLRVVQSYRESFPDAVVGLSAHDAGVSMALVAFALGARAIEKHFTLDKAGKGTDHQFSLEQSELAQLVRGLRRAARALGDGRKRPFPSEERPLWKMGKHLVAARALPAGHVLQAADVAIRSPRDGGLPPYELAVILGKRLGESLAADQPIRHEHLR